MKEDHTEREARVSSAITTQREAWGRQITKILHTRNLKAYGARTIPSKRASTLLELQTQFAPREEESKTLSSFYQTSLNKKTRRAL
jgi:hypothetical protein